MHDKTVYPLLTSFKQESGLADQRASSSWGEAEGWVLSKVGSCRKTLEGDSDEEVGLSPLPTVFLEGLGRIGSDFPFPCLLNGVRSRKRS